MGTGDTMNRREFVKVFVLAAAAACLSADKVVAKNPANVSYAVRDGLWSDRITWKHGVLPSSADLVFANGCRVIVDRDIEVKELRSDSSHGATDGGTFIVLESRTLSVHGVAGGKSSPAVSVLSGTANVTIGPRNPNDSWFIRDTSKRSGTVSFVDRRKRAAAKLLKAGPKHVTTPRAAC